MSETWADGVIARLTDTTRCPACGEHLASVVCAACGLDISVREAREVWRLSVDTADLLREREALLDGMRRSQPGVHLAGRDGAPRVAAAQSPARAGRIRAVRTARLGVGPGCVRPADVWPRRFRARR